MREEESPIRIQVSGETGGVADYARALRLALPDSTGIDVVTRGAKAEPARSHFLLQYSGYGFQKRGAPTWLIPRMRTYKQSAASIGIFFHELYAFGPPWHSEFWLSPWQRRIVAQLAEIADYWVTNRESSAEWIRARTGTRPHVVLPVFSNVGEAAEIQARPEGDIVVFGSSTVRARVYRQHGRALNNWAASRGLTIHDVGPDLPPDTLRLGGLESSRLIIHGRLDEPAVVDVMRKAGYGVVAYGAHELAKSGIFAAYCAYGLCPIVLSDNRVGDADGLEEGVHYVAGFRSPDELPSNHAANIGQSAWHWYRPHRIEMHARAVLGLVQTTVSKPPTSDKRVVHAT